MDEHDGQESTHTDDRLAKFGIPRFTGQLAVNKQVLRPYILDLSRIHTVQRKNPTEQTESRPSFPVDNLFQNPFYTPFAYAKPRRPSEMFRG
jgi:hypothetical protein